MNLKKIRAKYRPSLAIAAIVVVLLAVAVVLGWVMRHSSERLLKIDAEQTALSWAEFVGHSIPDLDDLLLNGVLTSEARDGLKQVRRIQEVFRFKVFDRDGKTLLVSDEMDQPAVAPVQRNIGHGNEHVRNMVLDGKNVVLHFKNHNKVGRPPVYSEAYVPIKRQGEMIGVVEVYVDQSARAARIQSGFGFVIVTLFALLSVIGVVVVWLLVRRLRAQQRAEAHIRYLAQHDSLCGLLNRTSFAEALREAVRGAASGGAGFAVLCIDLDLFKEVNDTLGHAAGDEVLRKTAERLRSLARHGDRVARLGGDEFAILQSAVVTEKDVEAYAQRVVAVLGESYQLGDSLVHCGSSVGAAIFGIDAQSGQDLMKKADLALYRAKQGGRGGFSFYDDELEAKLEARRELVQDLREAVLNEQMCLYFQGQFQPDGKTLRGYEALLRWPHPVRGMQSPDLFIPLAEDTGLIDPLGRWVLRQACRQAAQWPDGLSVAVNLSAAQFRNGDLIEAVDAALAESGLAPGRLELEITESMLLSNTERVASVLESLAKRGIRIALDDFGTGYSSMTYLWRFPFHKIKIDRSFTEHLQSDRKVSVIIQSIIGLAHSLGIAVSVEGVETAEQMDKLLQYRCDELQGFLLGRPQAAETLPGITPVQKEAGSGFATADVPSFSPQQ